MRVVLQWHARAAGEARQQVRDIPQQYDQSVNPPLGASVCNLQLLEEQIELDMREEELVTANKQIEMLLSRERDRCSMTTHLTNIECLGVLQMPTVCLGVGAHEERAKRHQEAFRS